MPALEKLSTRIFTYEGFTRLSKSFFARTSKFSLSTLARNGESALHWLSNSNSLLNPSSFVTILQKCGTLTALVDGLHIHMCITALGFEQHGCIPSNLLHMYVECDASADAQHIFDRMPSRNQFAWNVIIKTYLRSGQEQEVFKLFQQMLSRGTIPDTFVFVSVISACSRQAHITIGMHIHAYSVNAGLDSHVIVATSLVNMYGKHGLIEDAVKQFDMMPERNVASWNTLTAACTSNNQAQFTIYLYAEMLKEGIFPDKVTLVNNLRACAILTLLLEGQKVHATLASKDSKRDVLLDTALLDFYGKCNRLEKAQEVFSEMQDPSVVSWTSLASAYAQHGDHAKVAFLYNQMHQECVLGDNVMLVNILDASACEGGLRQGKLVHACIACSDIEVELVMGTALVNMYGKNGDVVPARRIFNMIKQRNDHCWNSMFYTYLHCGHLKEALELLGLMQQEGKVTHELTMINILHLCGRQGAEAEGKQVHYYIVSDSLESSNVLLALIKMYSKLKSFCDTRCIFTRICECTLNAWNAMMSACVENELEKQALQSFEQMLQECLLPNRATSIIILNALPRPLDTLSGKRMHTRIVLLGFVSNGHMEFDSIAQYGNCGNLEMAQSIFDRLPEREVDAWKAIIAAAFNSSKFAEGIQLFLQMQSEGVLGNKVLLLSILDACARESSLARAKQLHVVCVGVCCDEDVSIGTALINIYGRCGCLTESSRVFYELPDRNLLTWTCMIAVLAQHGQGENAIVLFDKMQEERTMPDKVTFTSVLSACARSGLCLTGFYYLVQMSNVYGVLPVPDHFNCIVDLLGRLGQLGELNFFVESMPVQPTATTWTILLDACRVLSIMTRAEGYAKQVLEIDSEDAALFVKLSSTYVAASRDDVTSEALN